MLVNTTNKRYATRKIKQVHFFLKIVLLTLAFSLPMYADAETSGLVDINRAGLQRLQDLPGIGPAIAREILRTRLECGPFLHEEELLEVTGIGPALLKKLRPYIKPLPAAQR